MFDCGYTSANPHLIDRLIYSFQRSHTNESFPAHLPKRAFLRLYKLEVWPRHERLTSWLSRRLSLQLKWISPLTCMKKRELGGTAHRNAIFLTRSIREKKVFPVEQQLS